MHYETNALLKNALIDFNVGKPDLRDRYAGETGIIIANGPSLNDIPLDFLTAYPSMGMNNIYLYGMTDEEVARYPDTPLKFCPTFYCILGLDQLNSDEKLSYIKPMLPHLEVMFINRLLGPYMNYDKCYFFHTISLKKKAKAVNSRLFSFDPLDRIGIGFTNTYVACQLMFYLGFDTVYVVGCDNDYARDPEKMHFYPNDPRFCCEPLDGRRVTEQGSRYVLGLAKEAYEYAGRQLINVNDVNNTPLDCIKPEELEWND